MNTDIRIHIEFWSHAKTRKMIRAIGLQGPVSLQILWCYAAKNRPTGALRDMDADDIEEAAGWPVERRGEFFAYCTRSGWLDKAGRGVWAIHEWQQHNHWAAEAPARSLKARKAAHAKNHTATPKPESCELCREDLLLADSSTATSMLVAHGEHAPSRAPAPNPAPAPSPAPNPSPAPVAAAPSLPADGVGAMEIIQHIAGVLFPNMQPLDDFTASQWLTTINSDPWVISAALAEMERVSPRTASYFTNAIRDRIAAQPDDFDAKGYVEHRLAMRARRSA